MTLQVYLARLEDVHVGEDGRVLVDGHLVGWVRQHAEGWFVVVAGSTASIAPVRSRAEVVDLLLRHPARRGPMLLEHLSPARVEALLAPAREQDRG